MNKVSGIRINASSAARKFFSTQVSSKKDMPPGLIGTLYNNKASIFFAGSSILYIAQGYVGLSMLFATISFICFYKKSHKLIRETQNYIDETMTERRNSKINNAVEEIKKYIFRHPDLFRIFPEKTSTLHCVSWAGYLQNELGRGIDHEEKLSTKRWRISAEIINEDKSYRGYFDSVVLFHTPTHFVIEYLRVEVRNPSFRIITIIDGRRDMKDWVQDLKADQINTKIYPKYRPDDKVKH